MFCGIHQLLIALDMTCEGIIMKCTLITAVLEIWKKAEAVCFDVDSTVCTDEGLDALGEFCGAGEAVAALTTRF